MQRCLRSVCRSTFRVEPQVGKAVSQCGRRPYGIKVQFSPNALRTSRPGGLVALREPSRGVPATRLGSTGGAALTVEGLFEVPVDDLRAAHHGTLPALFG